ncbi:fasciclin domain-containing protein [Sphingosinicella sp. CPCC 101087]|uniref:fasciclin domain-containing protein n=1 Tax=Sphingosinicella sp. CPCC 101087 TaxID=2497754 RepID=UPI00101BE8CF|nr:fasciclin domain-containing protein [Sphingosinicella sp. CPCC 101087]
MTYATPLDHRDTYCDWDDALYRYADRNVYQLDPQTRRIEQIISLLAQLERVGVGGIPGGTEMSKLKVLALCLLSLPVAACGGEAGNRVDNLSAEGEAAKEERPVADSRSIGEALEGSADHVAFVGALRTAGLFEIFRRGGPYTVFAPVEAAFQAAPQAVRNRVESAQQHERAVTLLSYHIVPGTVRAEDIGRAIRNAPEGRAELATVTGANLTLTREGETILITDGGGGQARITRADQLFSNGVVHSIDSLLVPAG